jgi:putative transposase
VAAATKHALLGLGDQAVAEKFTERTACRVLQVTERRVNRWQARQAAGTLADRPAGGGAVHGLLDEEIEAILELAEEWGEIHRSHRKLAHRGSYIGRVWVSPASVWQVLVAHDLVLPKPAGRAPVQRKPWPDRITYRPNQVWGWDVTHFGRCRAAPCAFAIIDLVSRKWLATLLSAEETSTQVQVVFCDALGPRGWPSWWPPARTAACTPPPTRPRSRASSGTSRASGPIWNRSATPTSSALNWRWSAPTTTPSGCTPASATSPRR